MNTAPRGFFVTTAPNHIVMVNAFTRAQVAQVFPNCTIVLNPGGGTFSFPQHDLTKRGSQ